MARTLNKLTDAKAQSRSLTAGRHSDGGGLYLNVKPSGSKSWLFMWTPSGSKRREMGLGPYPAVSLARARKLAEQSRAEIAEGRDPLTDRQRDAEPTFADCVDRFLDQMESQWRNAKHRAQWRMTLTEYCAPIAKKRVSQIGTDEVLSVLEPIWSDKNETASRLRGRIERVLDYAKTRGWREGENPAIWRGHLKSILPPRQKLARGHHAAMPYRELPEFSERLSQSEALSARALEFLILTAARSGEVLDAKWEEIDFEKAVWTVPASRMKAGKQHRVALSEPAIALLLPLKNAQISAYIFPGQRIDRPLSNMAMTNLMRRMNVGHFTVHGFRSTFRDWVGEETDFQTELAERALAHQIGNAVERAYARGDALEKRRGLMEAWANYVGSQFAKPNF